MSEPADRFSHAIEAIDSANAADPNAFVRDGTSEPRELVYGRQMSLWLVRLKPAADEPLRLAARAQHIRRWQRPRGDYPQGRAGYLEWRKALQRFHAEAAAAILASVGYDAATIERVGALLRKERLKADDDTQALEDAACLVFLEHYLAEFAAKHTEDKVVDIVAQTWRKMSARGRELALTLDLPPRERSIIGRALARGRPADALE
jgi:hypothetical protein